MSRKNSPPSSPRGDGWWLASSPTSVLERLTGSPRIPDRPGSWLFVLDGFMTPGSFDAFGSGSYASKRVGFSGPTMVLSETRGLQLFWVMRGGIRCIWRLGAERRTQGLAHRLILSLDPERRKNRLANHRVNKPGLAWSCR